MQNHVTWNQQSDSLLKYLYEDLKIYSWAAISKELSQRLNQNFTKDGCRNRYVQQHGPVHRQEWTPEQQLELYRLHNQNGNRWAVIAQNLLGRTDNCVKNHFYSKLRKSLRTLNKIGKSHLKKVVREVSNTVLYKLTEATDQSLKQNSEISKQLTQLCFDLKNRLLFYDMDQKDIKKEFEYDFEKNLLLDLAQFNKAYKKKSKKEKNSTMGSENLKKLHEKKRRDKQIKIITEKIYQNHSQSFCNGDSDDQFNQMGYMNYSRAHSQVSSVVPRVTVNYVIKAPSTQQKQSIQKRESRIKNQSTEPQNKQQVKIQQQNPPNPNIQSVQNILRAQGILQQAQNTDNNNAVNFFRRQSSNRSFSSVRSVHSDSCNLDMFGDDLMMNSRFKDISQMEDDNHIFSCQNGMNNN